MRTGNSTAGAHSRHRRDRIRRRAIHRKAKLEIRRQAIHRAVERVRAVALHAGWDDDDIEQIEKTLPDVLFGYYDSQVYLKRLCYTVTEAIEAAGNGIQALDHARVLGEAIRAIDEFDPESGA